MSLARDTLVLMACSATKAPTGRGRTPALELYNGPMWQTLRTHKPFALPWANVLVLSGLYALIRATDGIGTYEARLTTDKAWHVIRQGLRAPNDFFGAFRPGIARSPWDLLDHDRQPFRCCIIAGAGEYRRVFDWLAKELQAAGVIAPGAQVLAVAGGIGEQREQLGRWLRSAGAGDVADAA